MSKQISNSSLTTRLFLEGVEVDLDSNIDIANTYAVADIKNISKKKSNFSKSITVPGTRNNNNLFAFLYNIKSTGADETATTDLGYSASITNAISGLTVVDAGLDGSDFDFPIQYGFEGTSFHWQLNAGEQWYVDVSGNTSGYVICLVNGIVQSCNAINSSVTRYFFPQAFYNFDDLLQIIFQTSPVNFAGNIGYNVDFKKKMRAYVVQDNQVILSGYAKMLNAVNKNGAVSYQLQVTSDLGGFIAALANLRLEDLYTTVIPDLTADPTGNTPFTISLPSPYDHQLTVGNILASWYQEAEDIQGIYYPLIDYGNTDTVGGTCFYTDTLRPCLAAKTYWDLIFDAAGYTYDSAFLTSSYFESLIIPYKDGNISIIDTYDAQITTLAPSGATVLYTAALEGDDVPYSSQYIHIFNNLISQAYNADYVVSGPALNGLNPPYYVAPILGSYNVTTSFIANYTLVTEGDSAGIDLSTAQFEIFVIYEVYPASGGTTPIASYPNLTPAALRPTPWIYNQPIAGVTVLGNPIFAGGGATYTSDNFAFSFPATPVIVPSPGCIIKIGIIAAFADADATSAFVKYNNYADTYSGSATLNLLYDPALNEEPYATIEYSTNLDNQFLTFKDFVPKSVKQIDYINSIIKLFNLYPVQDVDQPNHFYIYTRDEFYANQETVDWTNKLDLINDFTVKPIPELDASQLLFSYKKDKDWWNKYYDSLYGNFTYGSLRIETGYQFAHKVKDVMEPLIFSPTVMVEYGVNSWNSECSIEIINNDSALTPNSIDQPSNIVLASGYFASNGTLTPYQIGSTFFQPTQNNYSGTQFSKARVGVKILYWGTEYTITAIINPWAFQVDQQLQRPQTGTSAGVHRVTDQLYATNDGFTYVTDSNIIIPQYYDSSDNNFTHKPVKTEMKILFFKTIIDEGFHIPQYNNFSIQFTPILSAGANIFQGQANQFDSGIVTTSQYAWASHLDDAIYPEHDLLFAEPVSLFFTFPFSNYTVNPVVSNIYPTKNLYSRFWVNTVNEILDKDCKFVDVHLNLKSTDISNLDLSELVYIYGTNYRINEIKDYIPNASLTQVELIRQPKSQAVTPPPFVYAGPNQVVSGSTMTVMAGEVSPGDDDGEVIEEILWTQISGPSLTLGNTSSLTMGVSGITVGDTYELMLYGLDNYGQSAFSIMSIMGASHEPCTPTVSASNSGPIILPTSTAMLDSTAAGCNGSTIVSYNWTQISGGTAAIVSPTAQNTNVSGITASGYYEFQVEVTDSFSETNTAITTLYVAPLPTVTLHNFSAGNTMNVTGISGFAASPGYALPVVGAGECLGTYSGFTGAISVVLTGSSIPSGILYVILKYGGTQIDCVDVDSGIGTYTFGSHTFNGSTSIEIDFTTGRC
jgi:hypothetical protein